MYQGESMGQLDRSRKILVIDDYEDAATIVAEILLLHGHQARFAVGGHEGLCMASSFSPEVVFLDLGMPEIDGYQVARHLRLSYPPGQLRLVALSARGDELSRARAKAAGCDAHLLKPAALYTLIEAIEESKEPPSAA